MHEVSEPALRKLSPTQAKDLSLLVELEARWENLRKAPSRPQEVGSLTQTLARVQNAYDAFHGKLVAYNKQYTPAHVPELLLNTPSRLASWCHAMQELYLQVEHDPQTRCPVHLVEKAYRCAERMSNRMKKNCFSRSAPPATIRAAIEDFGALAQWCDSLASVAKTA